MRRLNQRLLVHAPIIWRLRAGTALTLAAALTLFMLACAQAVPTTTADSWTIGQVGTAYEVVWFVAVGAALGWAARQSRLRVGPMSIPQISITLAGNVVLATILLTTPAVFDVIASQRLRVAMSPDAAHSELAWWARWRAAECRPTGRELEVHLQILGLRSYEDFEVCRPLPLVKREGTRQTVSPEDYLKPYAEFGPGFREGLIGAGGAGGILLATLLLRAAIASGARTSVSHIGRSWLCRIAALFAQCSKVLQPRNLVGKRPFAWALGAEFALAGCVLVQAIYLAGKVLLGFTISADEIVVSPYLAVLVAVVPLWTLRAACGFAPRLASSSDVLRVGNQAAVGAMALVGSFAASMALIDWIAGETTTEVWQSKYLAVTALSLFAGLFAALLSSAIHWVLLPVVLIGAPVASAALQLFVIRWDEQSNAAVALAWVVACAIALTLCRIRAGRAARRLAITVAALAPGVSFTSLIGIAAGSPSNVFDTTPLTLTFWIALGSAASLIVCLLTVFPAMMLATKNSPSSR